MGVLSKECGGESETRSKWAALANPRVQGAICLAATIACTQGVPKMAASLLARSRMGSSLSMVGAAAGAVASPSVWASDGVQKSASFFTMIFLGFIMRLKITNPQFTKGIQALIMNCLLPCVTFKGLVGISMSRDMIKFPVFSGALVVVYMLYGYISNSVILSKSAIGSDIPARTATFLNATLAPGLSSFTFINEFGGPGAAGLGSLMDIAIKFYQLVVKDPLMRLFSPKESAVVKAPTSGGGNPLMAVVNALFKDNINIAILAGLIMSATGKKIADIGFVGNAIDTMAAAQTPVLFLLIGLTVNLSGNTPLVSSLLLLGRAAVGMLFTGAANMLMGFDSNTALVTTLFSQSAVSMLGYGILKRVTDSQSKERPAFSPALGFDLVGYSFPLSIILNTTACIAKDKYVKNLIPMGGGLLAVVIVAFFATKNTVQNKTTWANALAKEKAA